MTSLQIRCFLEVARCLNFSKAAENLFISQSSLSRNIILLEKELDMTLFLRSSFQGTQLTEAGVCMQAAFQEGQAVIGRAIEQVHSLSRRESIPLVFGLLEGQMLDEHLCAMLNALTEQEPRLHLKVVRAGYLALLERLHAGEADVILSLDCELPESPGLCRSPFYRLPTMLVLPGSVPLPGPGPYSITDFPSLPLTCVGEANAPHLAGLVRRTGRRTRPEAKIVTVPDLGAQISMLEMGKGMGGFDLYHSVCRSPNVQCVPVREMEAMWFTLAWKKDGATPAVRFFQEFYREWQKLHPPLDLS